MLTLFSEGTFMDVRRALTLTLVIPLLLAGCTDEPEPTPKIPDPTSSSPTPTATESEAPETESAEDFIRRWQEAGDEMQVTGETAPYLELTNRCTACQSLADNVAGIYEKGGRIEFVGSKIIKMQPEGKQPPTYDVALKIPKTVIYRSTGAKPETLPAGEMTIRVTLKQARLGWTVTRYGVL